jgi:hypothetical protein
LKPYTLNNIAELKRRVSYAFGDKGDPCCSSKKRRWERNAAMEDCPRRTSGEGKYKEKHV